MSLSLDQLFLSPNEEKKNILQNHPFIGDESSDENCSEEGPNNSQKLYSQLNKKKNKIKSDYLTKQQSYQQHHNLQNIYSNKINYASNFSSNQFSRSQNFLSNNLDKSSSNKKTDDYCKIDKIKLKKKIITNNSNNTNNLNNSNNSINSNNSNNLNNLNNLNNESNDKNTKMITDKNLLELDQLNDQVVCIENYSNFKETPSSSSKPEDFSNLSSALIKKGNLFKNNDYFHKNVLNKNHANNLDNLYNNRKTEKRKLHKNSDSKPFNLPSLNIDSLNQDALIKNDLQNISNNKLTQDLNEEKMDLNQDLVNQNNRINRTKFVNKRRNYHHYIQKDSKSKRASLTSIETCKNESISSSSSNSPIQENRNNLNDLICIKNKYVGYNIDEVINMDNLNKKKSLFKNEFLNQINLEKTEEQSEEHSENEEQDIIEEEEMIVNEEGKNSINECNKENKKFNLEDDDNEDHINNDLLIDYKMKKIEKNKKKFESKNSNFDDLISIKEDNLNNNNLNDLFTTPSFSSLLMSKVHSKMSNNQLNEMKNLDLIVNLNETNSNFSSDLVDINEERISEDYNNLIKKNQHYACRISSELLNFNRIDFENNLNANNKNNFSKTNKDYLCSPEEEINKLNQSTADENNKFLLSENFMYESKSSEDLNEGSIRSDEAMEEDDNKNIKDNHINVCSNTKLDKKVNDLNFDKSNSFILKEQEINLKPTEEINPNLNLAKYEGSPRRYIPKPPGYTQRILNFTNSNQVKYDLFQLGNSNNNLANVLDLDKNEFKETTLSNQDQFKLESNLINSSTSNVKDISCDELIKSILNIPFSNYEYSEQNEDETFTNIYSNKESSEFKEPNLEQVSKDLKDLNICDNKNILKSANISSLILTTSTSSTSATNLSATSSLPLNASTSSVSTLSTMSNATNNNFHDIMLNKLNLSAFDNEFILPENINLNSVNKACDFKSSRRNSNNSLDSNSRFKTNSLNNSLNNTVKEENANNSFENNKSSDKQLVNNINLTFNSNLNNNNLSSIFNMKNKCQQVTSSNKNHNLSNGVSSNLSNSNDSNESNLDLNEITKKPVCHEESDCLNNQTSNVNVSLENDLNLNIKNYNDLNSYLGETVNSNNTSLNIYNSLGLTSNQLKCLQERIQSNNMLNDTLIDVDGEVNNIFEVNNKFQMNSKSSPKNLINNLSNDFNNYLQESNSRNVEKYLRNSNLKYCSNLLNKKSEESVKNFSLSPETTDCESIEVESEFSISSFVSAPGLNHMPILEDGLSSGSASDTETSQNTKMEIDRNLKDHLINTQQNSTQQQVEQQEQMELFAKCRPRAKKNQQQVISDYENNLEKETKYFNENLGDCESMRQNQTNLCNDLNVKKEDGNRQQQFIKKNRSLSLNTSNGNNNGLNESLHPLNNGLLVDNNESHLHENENLSPEQLWNMKIQNSHQEQQEQSRGHYSQSNIGCENQNNENDAIPNSLLKLNSEKPANKNFHDDDCDTDQETDRLLGAQRSEERGFFDEKNQSIKKKSNSKEDATRRKPFDLSVLIEGVLFRARYLGSTQLICEGQPTKATRMMQAEEAVSRIKAPEGETQPSTEVDLFISTEKIMVLNTDLKEIMMDHTLRTISYIADIGDLLVLMARRRQQIIPNSNDIQNNIQSLDKIKRTTPKMICHVFESEEAQFIAQSIGQAFQVAYMEFLKANGIEDSSFVKEMDYQEVLNSQEIFGNELEMFARKEKQKEVIVPKKKGEILGMVVVESGWGSMLPTVVIANMAHQLPASRCGHLNIGDQIIAINGISLVGLPLTTCQHYIKNTKNQTVVKLTVVPCAPVVEVKIKRPDTKYQLGFSVQNGVICSLLRGGIAERGGVRVGHRIIEINGQSVVAVPHEKIVNLLATSVGEIHMKTMPTSMFRLLTGQEAPIFI